MTKLKVKGLERVIHVVFHEEMWIVSNEVYLMVK